MTAIMHPRQYDPRLEDIVDVDFHPTDNNQAIASSRDNGRAYYSTDGGVSWLTATATELWGQGRVEVAYAMADPIDDRYFYGEYVYLNSTQH